MYYKVYLCWLITSIFSFTLSFFMIIRILLNSSLRNKAFHRLMCLLAISDFLVCLSWFIGNRNKNTFLLCSIQEYLLQSGLLFRATITVILCYLSGIIISKLNLPTRKQINNIIIICFFFFICTLSCSIYFNTAKVFCSENESKNGEIAYVATILAPIYSCILLDFIFYILSRSRVSNLFVTSSSQTQSNSNKTKLLNIARQLLRYPIIYAVLLLPEVIYGIYIYITDNTNIYLSIISSCAMGSTGGIIALRYMFHHDPGILAISNILYSQEAQRILNFGTNFTSSINFSFHVKKNKSSKSPNLLPNRNKNPNYKNNNNNNNNNNNRYPIDSSSMSVYSTGTTETSNSIPFNTTNQDHFSIISRTHHLSHNLDNNHNQTRSQSSNYPILSDEPSILSSSSSSTIKATTTTTTTDLRPASATFSRRNLSNSTTHNIGNRRPFSERIERNETNQQPNSSSRKIWSIFFSSNSSYEFSHSRSISGSTERSIGNSNSNNNNTNNHSGNSGNANYDNENFNPLTYDRDTAISSTDFL